MSDYTPEEVGDDQTSALTPTMHLSRRLKAIAFTRRALAVPVRCCLLGGRHRLGTAATIGAAVNERPKAPTQKP
jgi:hypothetical protein